MTDCANCGPDPATTALRRRHSPMRWLKWGGAALAALGVALQLVPATTWAMASPVGGALMGIGLAGWLVARLLGRRHC